MVPDTFFNAGLFGSKGLVLKDGLANVVFSAKICLKMFAGLPVSFLSGRMGSPGKQL